MNSVLFRTSTRKCALTEVVRGGGDEPFGLALPADGANDEQVGDHHYGERHDDQERDGEQRADRLEWLPVMVLLKDRHALADARVVVVEHVEHHNLYSTNEQIMLLLNAESVEKITALDHLDIADVSHVLLQFSMWRISSGFHSWIFPLRFFLVNRA